MNNAPVNQEDLLDLYRSLIVERDELKTKSEQSEKKYFQMFKELYKEYYGLMIECIFLKKRISYCQRCKNHHMKIYKEDLEGYMDGVKEEYMHTLEGLGTHKRRIKETLNEDAMKQAKKIFKRIIKRINKEHPLWERTIDSYRYNDLEELMNIEALVDNETHSTRHNIDINYLIVRINRINEVIDFYMSHPPLSPLEKEENLKNEIEKYRLYKDDLNKQYLCFDQVMYAC